MPTGDFFDSFLNDVPFKAQVAKRLFPVVQRDYKDVHDDADWPPIGQRRPSENTDVQIRGPPAPWDGGGVDTCRAIEVHLRFDAEEFRL